MLLKNSAPNIVRAGVAQLALAGLFFTFLPLLSDWRLLATLEVAVYFMLSGVIIWIGALPGVPLTWAVGVAVGLVLIPVVYSYFLYRRVEGFESNDSNDDGLTD